MGIQETQEIQKHCKDNLVKPWQADEKRGLREIPIKITYRLVIDVDSRHLLNRDKSNKRTITHNKSRPVVELGLNGLQHPGRPHIANQLVLLAEDGGLQQVVHLLVARHLHRLILNV